MSFLDLIFNHTVIAKALGVKGVGCGGCWGQSAPSTAVLGALPNVLCVMSHGRCKKQITLSAQALRTVPTRKRPESELK